MQDTENFKNMIWALGLSTIVLLLWQYFYEMPRQEAMRAQQEAIQSSQQEAEPSPHGLVPEVSIDSKEQVFEAPISQQTLVPRAEALAQQARLPIRSEELRGSLSLKGARFDDLILQQYQVSLEENSPNVELFSPSGTKNTYFGKIGWLTSGGDIEVPNDQTVWQTNSSELIPNQPVTLFWENSQNIRFEMTITMDDAYMFTVDQRVINQSGKAITLSPYGLLNRSYEPSGQNFFILHLGPMGIVDGALEEIYYDDLKDEGKQTYDNASGWVGIGDKYWLSAIIPEDNQQFKANYQYYASQGRDRYQADYLGSPVTIMAGETKNNIVRLYAGAKKLKLLDAYSEAYNIPLFDRALDFGVLYFLTRPLFLMLNYFYALLGNFGLAILALTVVVKIFLFPLANKSYKAMGRMKTLMPKMKEIRERYGDDRVKMNQEVMALYKKEGVNPASGCLPMLLQIPIFFALYKVLFVTIEMRHAPFYGWIQDLSVPDPTNIFTLFGLLQWDAPAILQIGIWPLIMAVTMIIQQKLNPKPEDPVQAQVMAVLPYFFLFLFASFPAGLVIYWAWNNALSILQQWIITRKISKEAEQK